MDDLREWRLRHGLSQSEAAAYLSRYRGAPVYQHQVSMWERGNGTTRSTRAMVRRAIDAYDTLAGGGDAA